MKIPKLVLILSTCALSFASAQESVEFQGPDNAPIYVMEGEFRQTFSLPQLGGTWFVGTEMNSTMNVNSGAMTSVGSLYMEGSGNVNSLPFSAAMELSFAMKAVTKQAGNSVRWSGKAAISGPMSFQTYLYGVETFNFRGNYEYRNMTLDPETGEQTGLMGYDAVGRNAYGQRIPIKQKLTRTTLPRPTIYSSEGEWREVAGDWSTEIVADVFPKNTIRGTGELVVGSPDDPYANVAQKITGKLNTKTGVATLNGTGTQKNTSRVKVTLNYIDSSGETVAGRNSVSAYGQGRKF